MLKKAQKTAQREAIMSYLKDNRMHPSVADIYAAVSEQLGTISLTTVYNTLMLLQKEGYLKEVPVYGSSGKRFDPSPIRHDHIICRACNKVIDLDIAKRPEIPVECLCGFEPTDLEISIYGLCPECRKKSES